ncbi:MAG: hypothetical protein KAS66_08120 [Candidatus Omnitrophica bacterium]|nr:hypothetical protein [Candidatus Omnitrophota bacterium]
MTDYSRELTTRQENYIHLLQEVFLMKNARGQEFPYRPEPYQINYHADCMVANPASPNRLWKKARGIGASATTMMDALMVAHRYKGVKIPVGSVTGTQAFGPIEWAIWLADNPQIPGFFNRNKDINSICELDNGSIIFPVPGHNPEALRNYRTVFNVYDEFAFHPYPKKLKAAGDACLSEGGQINILSTLNGTENEYYRIIQHAHEMGYEVYEVPMFEPENFDVTKPIPEQIAKGKITPISPWVDVSKLEESRLYDPVIFMQEQMCSPEDAAISFLSQSLLDEVCRPVRYLHQNTRVGLNSYHLGIDFASENNVSAFEILEQTTAGWIHRARVPVQKTDTVQQNQLLRELDKAFGFTTITIDLTGPGTGFYHYAKHDFGSKVAGINFSTRHPIDEKESHLYRSKDQVEGKKGKITIPIKRAMAVNMKVLMEQGRFIIMDIAEYKSDLHSVNYSSLDAPRSRDSHGDEFWGTALAMWGPVKKQTQRYVVHTRRY